VTGPYREPAPVRRLDVAVVDDPSAWGLMDWFCAIQSAMYLLVAVVCVLMLFFRAIVWAAMSFAELLGG
jgi:hypothetical protein